MAPIVLCKFNANKRQNQKIIQNYFLKTLGYPVFDANIVKIFHILFIFWIKKAAINGHNNRNKYHFVAFACIMLIRTGLPALLSVVTISHQPLHKIGMLLFHLSWLRCSLLLIEVVWTFMNFKICLYFWGVFGPWRGNVASYTTDERSKNGQKERWRLNLEELNLQIKSSSEKFRRLHCVKLHHKHPSSPFNCGIWHRTSLLFALSWKFKVDSSVSLLMLLTVYSWGDQMGLTFSLLYLLSICSKY